MSNRNQDGDGLRVMTFNVLSPDHADWSRRQEIIRMDLRRLRQDLVALQECVWGDGEDQVATCSARGTSKSDTRAGPPRRRSRPGKPMALGHRP
jgi:endonuclease/exonuclease/phosphatase family metal-dependent hydrolase